jgi:flagellar protein FliS
MVMQNFTTYNRRSSNMNPYLVKDILEATPQQLVIKLYDLAIVSCKREDLRKTNNAIQALIDALNFEDESATEISTGLLKLYKFCQDQMREGNYSIVDRILSELRESWMNVFSRN